MNKTFFTLFLSVFLLSPIFFIKDQSQNNIKRFPSSQSLPVEQALESDSVGDCEYSKDSHKELKEIAAQVILAMKIIRFKSFSKSILSYYDSFNYMKEFSYNHIKPVENYGMPFMSTYNFQGFESIWDVGSFKLPDYTSPIITNLNSYTPMFYDFSQLNQPVDLTPIN